MSNLTPEKGLIFRIAHRDNVPWMIANGLHCKKSDTFDPNFVQIGNFELIDRRADHPVPIEPKGTLGRLRAVLLYAVLPDAAEYQDRVGRHREAPKRRHCDLSIFP
jgi:hypothetical protein